jgi:hypothetical protein
VQDAPQTAQRLLGTGRSDCTDFFAISKISGEIMGSAACFFFIVDSTIEHKQQLAMNHQVPTFSRSQRKV